MKNLFLTRLTIVATALASSLQMAAAAGLGNHYANRVAPDPGGSWARQNQWDISTPTYVPTANYVINDSRLKFTTYSGAKVPFGEARYVGYLDHGVMTPEYVPGVGPIHVYATTLWRFTNENRFGTLTVWNNDTMRWYWQTMTLRGFAICYTSRGMVALPWNGGYGRSDLPMPQMACPAKKINGQ